MSLRTTWSRPGMDASAAVAALDGTLPDDPDDAAARAAHVSARVIERRHRDLVAAFEPTVELPGVLVCHATPDSDTTILTPRSSAERFAAAVSGVDAPVVV